MAAIGLRSPDVPPVLREHRTVRALLLSGVLAFSIGEAATALPAELRTFGLSRSVATLLTVGTLATGLAALACLLRVAWTSECTEVAPPDSGWLAAGFAVVTGVALGLALGSSLALPRGVSAAAATAGAAAMFAALRDASRDWRTSRVQQIMRYNGPGPAEAFIERCRADLRDESLASDDRAVIELSLASSLCDMSAFGGRRDLLPEALDILERSLATDQPAWLVAATMSLGLAAARAEPVAGELENLQRAVDLVAAVVSGAPPLLAVAHRVLLSCRADALMLLRAQAESEGETARAERLHAAAIEDLRSAISVRRRWSVDRAQFTIELASIAWAHPESDGVDAAVEHCRRALRSLLLRPFHEREAGYITLARLLIERALQRETCSTRDLEEARRLCKRVAQRGRSPHRGLCELPLLQDALDADEAVVEDAFERAFVALSAVALGQARALASDWSWWAASRGYTEAAAEAHWCWLRAAAAESRLRVLNGDQDVERAAIQELAAETGFWLLAGGRRREAALALDLGRTVQLAERMHRVAEALDERLTEAGRLDLSNRWKELGEVGPPTARPRDGGWRRRTSLAGPGPSVGDRSALGDHERLLREISRVPGCEDVAVSPTYEELREAARDGPLVYLAAIDDGAFAVLVTEAAPDPEIVILPGVTSIDVEACARVMVGGADQQYDVSELLEAVLEMLGRWVIDPLARALPTAALVSLVPIGSLNLLPVHAARMRRGDHGLWADRTNGLVFRYAHTARALRRAQAVARDAGGPELPVLTVADADATAESSAVAGCFGVGLVRPPSSCAPGDVLPAFGEAGIWHLACPVAHDPHDPLSTCLQLRDGDIELRAMIAAAASGPRLAVFSACDMTTPVEPPLEEVVSLSSALVELGVAGVVSAQAVLDRHAAMLLVPLFFERFVAGLEPARALANAQDWLSNATNRQLGDAFGPLHPTPRKANERWTRERPCANPICWALFTYAGT